VTIDALDIAFIAIGARQALADSSAGLDAISRFEGELGYVQACIDQAALLDRVYHECDGTFPGIWCYEVAEPFGYAFGQHLLGNGNAAAAERILRDIVAESTTPGGA